MAIVEFKDVSRIYRNGDHEQRALDHVNLSLEEGKCIVVLGPSGAGKSTLLNMLGGLDSYDETDGRLIKTIAEGDTSVTYAERKSCAQRLESFIDTLCLTDSEIIRFRKFKW